MIAKEFERIILQSNATGGETLEIHFSDGSVVIGFVQHVKFNPGTNSHYVNLCKSQVRHGESSDHTVRFDKIIKLIVKPYNQNLIVFE